MIKRPCEICEVIIKVDSLSHKYCGEACAELARRRQRYAEQGVKPGHIEYTPTTPEQRVLHRTALKRKTND